MAGGLSRTSPSTALSRDLRGGIEDHEDRHQGSNLRLPPVQARSKISQCSATSGWQSGGSTPNAARGQRRVGTSSSSSTPNGAKFSRFSASMQRSRHYASESSLHAVPMSRQPSNVGDVAALAQNGDDPRFAQDGTSQLDGTSSWAENVGRRTASWTSVGEDVMECAQREALHAQKRRNLQRLITEERQERGAGRPGNGHLKSFAKSMGSSTTDLTVQHKRIKDAIRDCSKARRELTEMKKLMSEIAPEAEGEAGTGL